jgi:FkbM family methyltransferase
MKPVEKLFTRARHWPLLERADWLWDRLRPIYQRVIAHFGRKGLERIINVTDRILVVPEARGVTEQYEPDVWGTLMAEVRPGDTFVDVGAFIGLYAVAVGLRLQGSGKVIAFEPDIRNFSLLREHARINGLEKHVELHQTGVSDHDGQSPFMASGSSEARLVLSDKDDSTMIEVTKLDTVFKQRPIDILKIDVEGYEEQVLRGAANLLRKPELKPRTIFIEVHPYAWRTERNGSVSLLGFLNDNGYRVETLEGNQVVAIERYGEIVARCDASYVR